MCGWQPLTKRVDPACTCDFCLRFLLFWPGFHLDRHTTGKGEWQGCAVQAFLALKDKQQHKVKARCKSETEDIKYSVWGDKEKLQRTDDWPVWLRDILVPKTWSQHLIWATHRCLTQITFYSRITKQIWMFLNHGGLRLNHNLNVSFNISQDFIEIASDPELGIFNYKMHT